MTEISRNDGAYSRTTVFDNIVHEDDPLSQELRAVLDEFHWVPSLLSQTARVAVEMAEYGLDPATEQGQQTAARVLRARLTQTRQWVDGQADKLSRLADAEQKSAGTAVVYYIDLYGSAVKIGTSRTSCSGSAACAEPRCTCSPSNQAATRPNAYATASSPQSASATSKTSPGQIVSSRTSRLSGPPTANPSTTSQEPGANRLSPSTRLVRGRP